MAHTKMSFSLTRNTASSGRSSQEIIRCGWNGSLSIRFELSFMNMATDASNFEKMVRIPYQKDHFNPVRTEYSTMLRRQLAQGNNGLTKTKYLTFGIEAESMKQAKPRLIHIEIDLMNNFKRLGVRAKLLNGKERLHLMHDMFHMQQTIFKPVSIPCTSFYLIILSGRIQKSIRGEAADGCSPGVLA